MHLIGSSPNTRCPRDEESLGTRGKLGNWCVYKNVGSESSRKSETNISAGFHLSDIMFKCSFEPVPVFKGKKGKKKRSHRSCSIILFCFFHCSLKSVENSCQTEKKVLRPTSFSPAFGFTEKDTVNSKKLRREKTGREDRWTRTPESVKPVQLLWPRMQSTNVNVSLMHIVSSLIVV